MSGEGAVPRRLLDWCAACERHVADLAEHEREKHPRLASQRAASALVVEREDGPPLLRIEAVRQLLAECRAVDEVKDIHDKAQAIAAYYRQRGASLEIQNDAAEVRLHAERRLGQLLREMPKHKGGRPAETGPCDGPVPTLDQIGVTKNQSSVWQRIAALAEDEFEERIATAKENGLELTTTRVLRGDAPPKHSRPEPEDGDEACVPAPLDYAADVKPHVQALRRAIANGTAEDRERLDADLAYLRDRINDRR